MIVYSTASDSLPTVRVYTLTTAADYLPTPDPRYVAPALHPQARTYAIASASAAIDHVRHWSIVDTHGDGCAAYYVPNWSLVPAYEDWQAGVIDAIRHLRRWRYYSDTPD